MAIAAATGDRAPGAVLTSAVDGGSVDLAAVFPRHAFTILLFDGAEPTSEGYKRLVGLALALTARWGDRVAPYIVTRRNDRPFEIPCAVGILFNDRGDPNEAYAARTEQAYVIDTSGLITLHVAPVDASAVLAHLEANLD